MSIKSIKNLSLGSFKLKSLKPSVSLKSLKPSVSLKPLSLNKSIKTIQKTIYKSITQKNHTLTGDLIFITIVILSIFIIQQLIIFFKQREFMSPMEKANKLFIQQECGKMDKNKVCGDLTKRGKKKCSKYPCCVWVNYKKGKNKCQYGSASGPASQRKSRPFDEYYYLGKKFTNRS